MKQQDFISLVIMNQLGDIVRLHPYLSFGLMATGIEMLGACIDEHEIQKPFESGERFRNAILKLFPASYHEYCVKNKNYDLYVELRCGFLHSFLTKSNIALSERKSGIPHLSIWNNQLILVAEDLYEDLKNASEQVTVMLEGGIIREKFQLFV